MIPVFRSLALRAGTCALAAALAFVLVAGGAYGSSGDIVSKNLFSEDRKPPSPPPAPKPPPEVGLKELKQVKLIAIYALGKSKKALVLAPNTVIKNNKKAKGEQQVWIRVGNVLAGYKVVEITPLAVMFKNEDGDEYELRARPEKKIIQQAGAARLAIKK